MNDRRHGNFSRADLVFLVASLGLLLALAPLLVGCASDSSRRINCLNNLRNVGAGVNSYAYAKARYPGYDNLVGEKPAGWAVVVLPQLEQQALYDMWLDSPEPPKLFIEQFVCPSNPPADETGAANSYVINAGAAPKEGEKPANGIAHDYRGTRVFTASDYISAHDGASYTLLLSENVQAGEWYLADKQSNVFVWHPELPNNEPRRSINGYGDSDGSLKNVPLSADSARPSSFHPGGVNVVFCDTRSIFIREDISYLVYMQLMTPSGRDSDMPGDAKETILSDADYQ